MDVFNDDSGTPQEAVARLIRSGAFTKEGAAAKLKGAKFAAGAGRMTAVEFRCIATALAAMMAAIGSAHAALITCLLIDNDWLKGAPRGWEYKKEYGGDDGWGPVVDSVRAAQAGAVTDMLTAVEVPIARVFKERMENEGLDEDAVKGE